MKHPILSTLFLRIAPASVLIAFTTAAIWGRDGLETRDQLRDRLHAAQAELARLDTENQRLLRRLRVLDRSPEARERLVADELHLARPGTTVIRFDDR
ncbi:MAG: septum formation initiator family protein [Myxococcota bacterium]